MLQTFSTTYLKELLSCPSSSNLNIFPSKNVWSYFISYSREYSFPIPAFPSRECLLLADILDFEPSSFSAYLYNLKIVYFIKSWEFV